MANMSFWLYALLSLTVIDVIWCDDCSISGTLTVQNIVDPTGFPICTTFSGDVAISTSYVGAAVWNDIETITGTLHAHTNLRNHILPNSLWRDYIVAGGAYVHTDFGVVFRDTPNLTSISLRSLRRIDALDFINCPALTELNLGSVSNRTTIMTSCLLLQTGLANLKGAFLQAYPVLRDFQFSARSDILQAVDVEIPFASVENINLGTQPPSVASTFRFPNLTTADLFRINENVIQVDLPVLRSVVSTLYITDSSLKSFTAPNLLQTGVFRVAGNSLLSRISLPVLVEVYGFFQVLNNVVLNELNFPLLQTIDQGITAVSDDDCIIQGNVSSISFPTLGGVYSRCGRNFTISSTSSLDCTQLEKQAKGGVLGTAFTCTALSKPTEYKNTLTTGAKVGILVGSVLAIALICLAAWHLRRRYLMKNSDISRHSEMPAPVPFELSAEKTDAELEAQHGVSEALGQEETSRFTPVFELPVDNLGGDERGGRTHGT